MEVIAPLLIWWSSQLYACVPVTGELLMQCYPVELAQEVNL